MTLMFRFVADRKYLIDGVGYTYVEADDAKRNDPASGRENAYYFRNDLTRAQERWTESQVEAMRDRIKARGTGAKINEVSRPVALKRSELRMEAVLRAYDLAPFPLRKKQYEAFSATFAGSHPDIPLPSLRSFKTWVRTRGETGSRSERDFRDGRGRHSKRSLHPQVQWALERWPAPVRWPGSNLMHGGLVGDV